MKATVISGLYAIIDTSITAERELLSRAEAVLAGGARVLQYRDKSSDHDKRLSQAQALRDCCRDRQVAFIVNDDYRLAAAVAADGVHLGEEDGALSSARDYLGEQAIIGVSCYDQPPLAIQAQRDGADYIAFGRCYPSVTKPGERYVTLEQIRRARQQLTIPIVGIGGINVGNVAPLIAAGVDAVAVIGALFATPDSEVAAKQICEQISRVT